MEGYALEAEEVPLIHDFTMWARGGEAARATRETASGGQESVESGYECEIAGCHEHIIEVSRADPTPLFYSQAAPLFEPRPAAARRWLLLLPLAAV